MITTIKKDFSDDLARAGLKATRHRTEILDILSASELPLAAEEVFLALNQRKISVSLSTVYRALDVLSEKKLVKKRSIPGDSRTLFEYNRMVHKHYLICLGCNKILPIEHCPLGDYEKSLAKETDFSIAGHNLDIYGYCPECQKKRIRKE